MSTKTEDLKFEIGSLLLTTPVPLWPSETQEKIELVDLGRWQFMRFKRQPDGYEQRLLSQPLVVSSPNPNLKALSGLLSRQPALSSFTRKTKDKNVMEVIIANYFGWRYVGVRFKIKITPAI